MSDNQLVAPIIKKRLKRFLYPQILLLNVRNCGCRNTFRGGYGGRYGGIGGYGGYGGYGGAGYGGAGYGIGILSFIIT